VIRWVIVAVVLAPFAVFIVGACCASKRNDTVAFRIESEHDRQVDELRCYIEAQERAGLDAWARATGTTNTGSGTQ